MEKTGIEANRLYIAATHNTTFIAQRPFFAQARKMLKRKLNLYSRVAMWIADEGPARSMLLHLGL